MSSAAMELRLDLLPLHLVKSEELMVAYRLKLAGYDDIPVKNAEYSVRQ